MIGKGIIKVDDYIRFGRLVDKLLEFAHSIQILKKNVMIITVSKSDLKKVEELDLDITGVVVRGGLAFVFTRL